MSFRRLSASVITYSRAERLAALGYVALAFDLHGDGRFIADLAEAMAALQPLFDDRLRTRSRAGAALAALAARPEVDPTRIAVRLIAIRGRRCWACWMKP